MKEEEFFKQEWGKGVCSITIETSSGILTMSPQDIFDTMKAYAEQVSQQAVVEFAKEYVFPLMDLSNFVAENLKDNPWCSVYNLQEQNEKIEKHLGIKPDYTPTKYED